MVAARRDRRVDPGPQRGRGAHARVQPHQAAPAAVQHPAARRQELPVPGRHGRRRVAPADGDAGRASARACATSAPTATPTPSARRSTCCCARSRCAPAATTSSGATSASAGPACCSTSRSARDRASARSTTPPTTGWSTSCSSSSTATPTRSSAGSRAQMRAAAVRAWSTSGPPGCATGSTSVRKAIERQQMVADRNEDLDVIGIAEDDLEAAVQVFFVRKGRVVGPQGLRASTRSRTWRPASSWATCSRASTTTRRSACRSRCWCRPSPTTPSSTPTGCRTCGARGSRCGCRSGGRSASCRPP